jgi:hypothetical protein
MEAEVGDGGGRWEIVVTMEMGGGRWGKTASIYPISQLLSPISLFPAPTSHFLPLPILDNDSKHFSL